MAEHDSPRAKYVGVLVVLGAFGIAAWALSKPVTTALSKAGDLTFTFYVTNIAAVFVFAPILLSISCLLIRADVPITQAIGENVLALVIGAVAGWALALYWVPYDDLDSSVYGRIIGAIALFVSGYGLSKLNGLVDAFFPKDKGPKAHVITKASLLLASFAVAAITIVTNRVEYLQLQMQKCPERYTTHAKLEAQIQTFKSLQLAARFTCNSAGSRESN